MEVSLNTHDGRLPRDMLPLERGRSVSPSGLTTVVLIAFALVLTANFAASYFIKHLPVNRGNALALGKWTLEDKALVEQRRLNVLIVGDSSANQGLSPALIKELTGQRAINLAVTAEALPVESVWAVRRWFENTTKTKRPKNVLWMHVYDIWARPDPGHRHLLSVSSALPPTAWPQIAKGPPVRFKIDEVRWLRWTPLWSQNASMQLLIRRPLDSIAQARRFHFDQDGFTAEQVPDPAMVERDVRNHLMLARSGTAVLPNPLAQRSFRAMAALADKYHFDVWIVESPVNAGFWAEPALRARWFEVHEALEAFAAGHERVHLVFDQPMTFPDAQMQNCDHVIESAARAFTQAVAARVFERPKTTRPSMTSTATIH